EEAAAAADVLGVTYSELGIAVARYWNFPDCIVETMTPVAQPPSTRPAAEPERQRLLAAFATEVSAGLSAAPQDLPKTLAALAARYEGAMGIGAEQLVSLARSAAEKFMRESRALNLPPLSGSLLASLQALQPGHAGASLGDTSGLKATLPTPV